MDLSKNNVIAPQQNPKIETPKTKENNFAQKAQDVKISKEQPKQAAAETKTKTIKLGSDKAIQKQNQKVLNMEKKPASSAYKKIAPKAPTKPAAQKTVKAPVAKTTPAPKPVPAPVATKPAEKKIVPSSATEEVKSVKVVKKVDNDFKVAGAGEKKTTNKITKQTQKVETKITKTATSYGVQLGSFKSDSEAKSRWSKISSNSYLKSAQEKIVRADLGAKGIYYRLRVINAGDKTAAQDLCSNLKKSKIDCFIYKN